MNLTLHLTADCNFNCRYCYEKHSPARMDEGTALAACELLFSYGHKRNGFSLFGGEPLLCRGVIERVTDYCAERSRQEGSVMSYKMTTNGSLLDESFMQLAREHGIEIALSHDGPLQDEARVFPNGAGSSALLDKKIDLLLSYQPEAVAMLTVESRNVKRLYEAVVWLYERGFSRVNSAIDLRPEAVWRDEEAEELANQYALLADFCAEHYDDERPLRYLNLESKAAAYLNGKPCIECRLGVKQPSVAPDGKIYPCNQFLNDERYLMGSVFSGIDVKAQERIFRASLEKEESCIGCALEDRCRHHCACLNHSMTGDMHTVPPLQCAHEKAVIFAADRMAAQLYKRNSPRFMRVYGK